MKQMLKWIYMFVGILLGAASFYFWDRGIIFCGSQKEEKPLLVKDETAALKALRAKVSDRKPLKITFENLFLFPEKAGDALTPEMVRKIMTKMALKQYKAKGVSFVMEADYNWIASLTPDVSYKVLKLLRALPMEYWDDNIKELKRIPEGELKVHLKRRLETDVYCHDKTGNCYPV